MTFPIYSRIIVGINKFIHKHPKHLYIMAKEKTTGAVIIRDKFGTYHNRLKMLIQYHKTTNPDNLTPDELDRLNLSTMLRKLIDDQFHQVFGPIENHVA